MRRVLGGILERVLGILVGSKGFLKGDSRRNTDSSLWSF